MAQNTQSLNLELDSSQYAGIADGSQTGLDFSQDFTLEAWVKLESSVGSMAIAAKRASGGTNRSYNFFTDASGNLQLQVYQDDSTADSFSATDTAISDDTWTHVAIAYDRSAGNADFYYDTAKEAETGGSITGIQNGAAPFNIGATDPAGADPDNYFDGLIDEVRAWSTYKSAGDIASNWKSIIAADSAGLEGYWRLEGDYLDETSNDNDLTASGSPTFSTDVPFTISAAGGDIQGFFNV